MSQKNRSSNTEMVSVPEGFMLVERSIWTEQQVDSAAACITLLKDVPGMTDRDLAIAAIDAAQCKAPDITLADILPAEQHQGERVDLNGLRATGISQLATGWNKCIDRLQDQFGPLYTRPAQGEPVAYLITPPGCAAALIHAVDLTYRSEHAVPLYPHADPAEVVSRLKELVGPAASEERIALRNEVERLRASSSMWQKAFNVAIQKHDTLRAQLAEAHALLGRVMTGWKFQLTSVLRDDIDAALSASAEPSAPTWACQSCWLEQPTDRPCDVCDGKTEPVATKS